jgi:hypothetical protein
MIAEKAIGPHRLVQVAADVNVIYYQGSPNADELTECIDTMLEWMGDKPFYLVLDLRTVETVSAAARRVIGEAGTKLNFQAIAVFGANFHLTVVAKLVNSAIGLFRKRPMLQEFFDTEAAALGWCDQLRRKQAPGGA